MQADLVGTHALLEDKSHALHATEGKVAALQTSCMAHEEGLLARAQQLEGLSGHVTELEGVRDQLQATVSNNWMRCLAAQGISSSTEVLCPLFLFPCW